MMPETESFLRLAVALAIGLLVGTERGWDQREAREGARVAGLRTFGLVGLLGGATGLFAAATGAGAASIGLVFLGLAAFLSTSYAIAVRRTQDVGITSEVAALCTFLLAALAGAGTMAPAAAAAIVMTMLLRYKARLHGWLGALRREELTAGLQLLLISVVLLPLLPDRGYGPWQTLNPYVLWWMVVLIASLSFVGYVATRVAGERRGLALTGLFGGLASSTAVTLGFSRLASRREAMVPVLAASILLACGTMFPRMVVVASLVHASLFERLWLPALVMSAVAYAPVPFYLRGAHGTGDGELGERLRNPLELTSALAFGVLLAVVMLLAQALVAWWGHTGVWMLAALSGLADVDAITLSLARMSRSELSPSVAAAGVVLAAAANSLFKGGLALAIGGRALGARVLLPLCLAMVAGFVSVWVGSPL